MARIKSAGLIKRNHGTWCIGTMRDGRSEKERERGERIARNEREKERRRDTIVLFWAFPGRASLIQVVQELPERYTGREERKDKDAMREESRV